MLPKTKNSTSRIKVHELPVAPASGGDSKSLEYPQLYRLRLGDWQVSYAVEHNKLVILVLEGLESEHPAQEKTEKKPRVKVKNLLENATPVPPQANKAARIKLRNLLDEVKPEPIEGGEVLKKVKIKLLDLLKEEAAEPSQEVSEEALLEDIAQEEVVPAEPEARPKVRLVGLPASGNKK